MSIGSQVKVNKVRLGVSLPEPYGAIYLFYLNELMTTINSYSAITDALTHYFELVVAYRVMRRTT